MNSQLSHGDDLGQDDESLTAIAVAQPAPSVPSVVSLLNKAVEHDISVEGLEKLLAMHERMQAAAAQSAFLEALSAFQADCPVIPKRKTASTGSYSYRYAPLEDIVRIVSPLLRRHGLSYRFDTAFEATELGQAQVVTCIVYHRDGHSETSEFRTPVDLGARMNDMQKSASAQTYAKRYAFCNAFGILTGDEDNDGHGARPGLRSGPGAPRAAAAPPSAPPSTGRVVRIARPSPGSQDSGGPASQDGRDETVPAAETPAALDEDSNDAEKAKIRQGLIEDWMALLRATGKFDDLDESSMWTKAADVLSAQCVMQFRRPLHEMSLAALRDARHMTDETLARKNLGGAA